MTRGDRNAIKKAGMEIKIESRRERQLEKLEKKMEEQE